MEPFDVIFVCVVVGFFLDRPKSWRWMALVPLFKICLTQLPFDHLTIPIIAAIFCLVSLNYVTIAFLLALPQYNTFFEVITVSILWLTVCEIMDSLEERMHGQSLHWRLRGLPVKIITVAVLYLTFYPLKWLW